MVANQSKIFAGFRDWLKSGGYSDSAISQYNVAVRLALGLLDKPVCEIDPATDLDGVRDYLARRFDKASTLATYHKGLAKMADYLCQCYKQPPLPTVINWDTYLGSFPTWLADDLRAYILHCRRAWLPERWHILTLGLLNHLTGTLRGLIGNIPLTNLADLTPTRWFDYLDLRLHAGIKPNTLNRELYDLQDFLRFVGEWERPICGRVLNLKPLATGERLPRDVPIEYLHRLSRQIEAEAATTQPDAHYKAVMDRAWFWLMLHSGLRTCEIRRLCLSDLNLEARQVRIEQSKGLQDRIVFLSQTGIEALKAYLALRGPAETDHVFIYRCQPLKVGYCGRRLRFYGKRCELHITPHQLRFSCATLLLNTGTPVLTVQRILGHQRVETTLRYARLYDSTIARDYERVMAGLESRDYPLRTSGSNGCVRSNH
ncbi:MAG: tyrosine-type recombinase/integrase [Anaerolineales bacterium]|nr:tyrosine-type recombinase/integrase [Anaerolineales bacterium]